VRTRICAFSPGGRLNFRAVQISGIVDAVGVILLDKQNECRAYCARIIPNLIPSPPGLGSRLASALRALTNYQAPDPTVSNKLPPRTRATLERSLGFALLVRPLHAPRHAGAGAANVGHPSGSLDPWSKRSGVSSGKWFEGLACSRQVDREPMVGVGPLLA
jgi:hypothetical protein